MPLFSGNTAGENRLHKSMDQYFPGIDDGKYMPIPGRFPDNDGWEIILPALMKSGMPHSAGPCFPAGVSSFLRPCCEIFRLQ
ncbi:hypothetical protein DCM91_05745 [Chitinophaga costaii]|nr:hypothetical protein DCM91_05745 [Chitinophaga costaii]